MVGYISAMRIERPLWEVSAEITGCVLNLQRWITNR